MKAFFLLALGLAGAGVAAPAPLLRAQEPKRPVEDEGLFLDMARLNLGPITSEDDKKKYIYAIQLEKERLLRRTLKGVYENAFDLYRRGDFDGARELTGKILTMDPSYEDAAILQRAATELKGSPRPYAAQQKLIEDRFEEGMALYSQGRLVESVGRWEEAVQLSPSNLKARWWLKKARGELADEHFRRGQKAYRQHLLRECLDQWYAALVLNPRYPLINASIAKVEAEAREAESNERLQTALNLYSQGLIDESLAMLDKVLESGPGNDKAQKLQAEIRSEMASQHVAQGRRLYESRRYTEAIAEWKKAVAYGYEPRSSDQLIARAKEQMRREDTAKRRAEQLAKAREEEAKKKAEEEAKAKEVAQSTAAVTTPGSPGGTAGTPAAPLPEASVEENRRQAQQYYLSGLIYYQKQDFEKARNEWTRSLQLDPSNSDAKAGLERINNLYGGGQ